MKITDFLASNNKIKKFKYKNYIWKYNKELNGYFNEDNIEFNIYLGSVQICDLERKFSDVMNDEIEIIEDKPKKIEKMTVLGKDITLGSMENWIGNKLNDNEQKICSAIDIIGIKTNEIIIALNYLLEKSDKE